MVRGGGGGGGGGGQILGGTNDSMTVHYTRPRYYIHKRISEYFRYKHMQTSDRCTYTRCHQPQIQEFVMGGGGGGGGVYQRGGNVYEAV